MRTGAMSVFAAAALLGVGSGPALAKPKPRPKPETARTGQLRYDRAGGVAVGAPGIGPAAYGGAACVEFRSCAVALAKDERYVTVTVADDSGLAAGIHWPLPVPRSQPSYGVACNLVTPRIPGSVDPTRVVFAAAIDVPDCPGATTAQ